MGSFNGKAADHASTNRVISRFTAAAGAGKSAVVGGERLELSELNLENSATRAEPDPLSSRLNTSHQGTYENEKSS
jgi:hypothetical protein